MSDGRVMRMVWNTDRGEVTLTFPSDLSDVDIDDVEQLFDLAVRGMRRRASKQAEEPAA